IQLAPENVHSFSFEYSGSCAQYADVLTDSILTGLLGHHISEAVNLINARHFAEERGLQIKEIKSDQGKTYNDLMTIRFDAEGPYQQIAASVFGEQDYRIVEIDGFGIEVLLEGDIVMYKNVDKPGMLAGVSSTMAEKNINIGSLSLGSVAENDHAITAVSVDQKISDVDLQSIREVEGVEALRSVSLYIRKFYKKIRWRILSIWALGLRILRKPYPLMSDC